MAQARAALEWARRHGSQDDVATQALVWQAEGLLAAAAGQAGAARAAIADAIQREHGEEAPDSVGEAHLTAADAERMLGNVPREREHLIAARALFEVKGNVVRARAMESRLS